MSKPNFLSPEDYKLFPEGLSKNKAWNKLNEFYMAAIHLHDSRAREKAYEFLEYLSENQLLDGMKTIEAVRIYRALQEDSNDR